MLIKQICLEGIRNLQTNTKLEFHQDLNVFIGPNGSGKTSLLESMYFLALGRSFRTARANHMIKIEHNHLAISAVYTNKKATQLIKISAFKEHQNERITKIGEVLTSNAELISLTPIQLINDETSDLIFKSPELRRKFIEWLAFYASKNYQLEWKEFNRVLQQRNQILKTLQCQAIKDPSLLRVLANLDEIFIKISEKITVTREIIWHKFEKVWQQVIKELALESQILVEIKFFKGWTENLLEQILKNRNLELKFGFSQCGPHKADLKFIVNHKFLAKEVLSRGQGKLLALTMILARSKFIREMHSHSDFVSVLLIDDLCAELDDHNIEKVVKNLCKLKEELQIFITGTDLNKLLKILPIAECKWFKVDSGRIVGCEQVRLSEEVECST